MRVFIQMICWHSNIGKSKNQSATCIGDLLRPFPPSVKYSPQNPFYFSNGSCGQNQSCPGVRGPGTPWLKPPAKVNIVVPILKFQLQLRRINRYRVNSYAFFDDLCKLTNRYDFWIAFFDS